MNEASPLGKAGMLDPLTSYPSPGLLTVQKSGCCVIPCRCSSERWCPNLSVCGDLVDPKNMHLSGWTAIRRIHHHHFICSNNVKTNTLETVQWYSLWARHTRLIRALTVALSLHLIYWDNNTTVKTQNSHTHPNTPTDRTDYNTLHR